MAETDKLFFGFDYNPEADTPINFIESAFEYLSPFSAHEVELDGVIYKSAEHAYQALRCVPGVRARVMSTSSAKDAWREGQRAKERGEILADYDKDALMERIFRAKLAQHPDIAIILRATGTRELRKNHNLDIYWGTGVDGSGENHMGRLWMKLRDELR